MGSTPPTGAREVGLKSHKTGCGRSWGQRTGLERLQDYCPRGSRPPLAWDFGVLGAERLGGPCSLRWSMECQQTLWRARFRRVCTAWFGLCVSAVGHRRGCSAGAVSRTRDPRDRHRPDPAEHRCRQTCEQAVMSGAGGPRTPTHSFPQPQL